MVETIHQDLLDSAADLLVVPVSSVGTISRSFTKSLNSARVTTKPKQRYQLGEVEFKKIPDSRRDRVVAYACTVSNGGGSYASVRKIAWHIAKYVETNRMIKSIASPILGTGAGTLNYVESRNIFQSALFEKLDHVHLVFCIPDLTVFRQLRAQSLDTNLSSSQLVFLAEFNRIMSTPLIDQARNEKTFLFNLAAYKFNEYLNYKAPNKRFYSNILLDFKSRKLPFSRYFQSTKNKQKQFLQLCGELVAYIDFHAYQKQEWNQNVDKRILANSRIRETHWITNLIKFRESGNSFDSIQSKSVKNALYYLYDPKQNISMLSDHHREMVFENVLRKQYEGPQSLHHLFDFFYKLDIQCVNKLNDGFLFTRILYLPFIRQMWLGSPEQSQESIFTNVVDKSPPRATNLLSAADLIAANLRSKNLLLDLGRCGIEDLNELPSLFDCQHLEILILSNEWGENDGSKWIRRTSGNKGKDNFLHELPIALGKLRKLKTFICGGNWKTLHDPNHSQRWNISDITVVADLKRLTSLNLSNNEIRNISPISRLNNLKIIQINNNYISDVPSLQLKSLQELYLSNNLIKNLNFLTFLPSLNTLDLHSNHIKNIRPLKQLIQRIDIIDSKWSPGTINIANNPLNVPEIISQGKDKILAYFSREQTEREIRLKPYINNDIKLVFVGNSNSGKSSLMHWLDCQKVEENISSTHWMVIKPFRIAHKGKTYTVHGFDFGGQEYYHDTHNIFFSTNTAYLLLWDRKSNFFGQTEISQIQRDKTEIRVNLQTFPLEYWLDSIEFHTKRRNGPVLNKDVVQLVQDSTDEKKLSLDNLRESEKKLPDPSGKEQNILIVQNKVDTPADKEFIDEKTLSNTYNQIYDYAAISVHKNNGLARLNDLLFEIFDSMQIIQKKYVRTWGLVKVFIENDPPDTDLTIEEFVDYCNLVILQAPELNKLDIVQIDKLLFNVETAESLASFLNDIGVALFFQTNSSLRHKIFLNQQIIVEGIYHILDKIDTNTGIFSRDSAMASLRDNAFGHEVDDLLSLMVQFKIIFEHPTKPDAYIAPQFLPVDPPKSILIFDPVFKHAFCRFQYENFIHKHVILDFFSKYGRKAMQESSKYDLYYFWRNGIVTRNDVTDEIVMVKFVPITENGVKAHVDVYSRSKSDAKSLAAQIASDLEVINSDWGSVSKLVTSNGTDFVPLKKIKEAETEGNWTFQHEKKYFKLIDFKSYLTKSVKMKKIFISYSKQDHPLILKFIDHLSALQLDGKVGHWYCSELIAGTDWNKEIDKHLELSDIACFMISPNFMKTKYIHEYEIAKALEKSNVDSSFRIVPIILDFCSWTTEKNNLGKFTALPYTAKPIADFRNQNMAWYIIEQCLRLMIDLDVNPVGDDFYTTRLPSDVLRIYNRIVKGLVDDNADVPNA